MKVQAKAEGRRMAVRILAELRDRPTARTAELRAVRRGWSKKLRDADAADVIAAADALIDAGAPRFVAYELIEAHEGARARLDGSIVRRLGRDIASWGDADAFGVIVAGPAWREGRIDDAEVRDWAASPDRWWRRIALVATVPLNLKSRGGTGDATRTLDICDRLIADRDDMVVKAMSWALRALSEREPDVVRRYMAKHGDDLHARVRREVDNKLRTGRKAGLR